MSIENLDVTLGVTYFIEMDISRFPDLLTPDYTLVGQIRESVSNTLLASFNIIKSPDKNRIYAILDSTSTTNLVINKQKIYNFDIVAKFNTKVFKLVYGNVNFQNLVTSLV